PEPLDLLPHGHRATSAGQYTRAGAASVPGAPVTAAPPRRRGRPDTGPSARRPPLGARPASRHALTLQGDDASLGGTGGPAHSVSRVSDGEPTPGQVLPRVRDAPRPNLRE